MISKEILVDSDEIKRYADAVDALAEGKMDADRFMAFRLQHGIYGQRQDGVHMVRIKAPGGCLNTKQLHAMADAMDHYSQDQCAQVTTRQSIQFHFVPLKDTPALMRDIGKAGLTTREACGNTVRNMTACSLAGVCPKEHTDITTFLNATTERFLRHPLTQHLPRKFKMSFSGCETDCAMGLMHDVGVVATKQGDKFGFKVLAGGGLGHKPHPAIIVEDFIGEEDLLPVIEALIALHNRYSDRKRRAKSRIKFLVSKFGQEGFLEKYKEELARARVAYGDIAFPRGEWTSTSEAGIYGEGAPRHVVKQKQAGLNVFPIHLPTGDITAAQLRGIAQIMEAEELDDLRTTVDQNLIILNVPSHRIDAIRAELQHIELSAPKAGDNVVSCPGTTTCRLGITSSKLIAPKLTGSNADLRIRVSGCHNSCGQHHVADIGIHGEGKRRFGRLIPSYVMHIGGNGIAGGDIALKGPVIPTMRIEQAIARVQDTFEKEHINGQTFTTWSRDKGVRYFHELLNDLASIDEHEIAAIARDHGEDDNFRVLQLGGGECAGAAQDLVASNFSEAMHERNYRNAFVLQRKYEEGIECAEQILRLVGHSVLFVKGQKPVDELSVLGQTLQDTLPENPNFTRTMALLIGQAQTLSQTFDLDVYEKFRQDMDQWIIYAGELCQELDQQLDLTTSLAELGEKTNGKETTQDVIDLSTYACPLHYIKARNELRNAHEGQTINFILTGDDSVKQVSNSLKSDGHEILNAQPHDDATLLTVRKVSNIA